MPQRPPVFPSVETAIEPTIDRERHPGDVAGRVARQEYDRTRLKVFDVGLLSAEADSLGRLRRGVRLRLRVGFIDRCAARPMASHLAQMPLPAQRHRPAAGPGSVECRLCKLRVRKFSNTSIQCSGSLRLGGPTQLVTATRW